VFQALADPHRMRMVERLSGGPVSVSALAEPLAMSLPADLQHLQVLEAGGREQGRRWLLDKLAATLSSDMPRGG
jgi:DNA-binding transcriptional ArsR family regulator